MKNIIVVFAASICVSAMAYIPGSTDPSTLTNWTDKVAAYQLGLKRVTAGEKIAFPERTPREPSVADVNLFIEGEILAYTAAKTAEMESQFPGLTSADYLVFKNMTRQQIAAYRRRYKAAWLEAWVDTTDTEYLAWLKMTPAERSVWEAAWGKAHKGCTEFVPPPLIEGK